MNERIHSCLNGELPLEALSPRERAQLQEMQSVVGAVASHLRAHPAPDLVASVMQALPASVPAPVAPAPVAPAPAAPADLRPPAWQRALSWLWSPQPIHLTLRPAYALAGVLVLVLSLPLASRVLAPQGEPMDGTQGVGAEQWVEDAEPPRIYVQFRLEASDADHVALAGSFTSWRPEYLLEETEPGIWTALVPLQPGVHDYAFLIDGQRWVVDPHAYQVPDSFGGRNSRLSLPVPSEST